MKRKTYTEFDPKEREVIYERDNRTCVNCGSHTLLEVAHIFVSRAFGGIGSRKNGALLCKKCHMKLDANKGPEIFEKVKRYLINHYGKISEEELTFRAEKFPNKKWKIYV